MRQQTTKGIVDLLVLFGLFIVFMIGPGCSVYLAITQPVKDLSLLEPKTSEDTLATEFGPPIWTKETNDGSVAVYRFQQSYEEPPKYLRAFLHLIADFVTLGIWEIPGTLLEMYPLHGRTMTAKVYYDMSRHVKEFELFDSHVMPSRLDLLRSGSLGLVMPPSSAEDLQTPSKSRLARAGRGLASGAAVGTAVAAPTVVIPPLAVFVAGAGIVLGSFTGAIYGAAVPGESLSSIEEKEATLKTALQNTALAETLQSEIGLKLREQGFNDLTCLSHEEVRINGIDGSYPAYDAVGIKSILELSPITVRVENEGLGIEPDKRIVISTWVRLIRTIDGLDLVYSYGEERSDFTMSLERWITNGGEPFQNEVINATHRLVDRMIKRMDIQR